MSGVMAMIERAREGSDRASALAAPAAPVLIDDLPPQPQGGSMSMARFRHLNEADAMKEADNYTDDPTIRRAALIIYRNSKAPVRLAVDTAEAMDDLGLIVRPAEELPPYSYPDGVVARGEAETVPEEMLERLITLQLPMVLEEFDLLSDRDKMRMAVDVGVMAMEEGFATDLGAEDDQLEHAAVRYAQTLNAVYGNSGYAERYLSQILSWEVA